MNKSRKVLTLVVGLILGLATSSVATPVLASTNSVEAVRTQSSKGFVHHIWYERTYFNETNPYVFVTVTRGNQAFRGYIQRRYTRPTGHGPTGVVYGGYLFNIRLKNYPIPVLNKKLPKLDIQNIPNTVKID